MSALSNDWVVYCPLNRLGQDTGGVVAELRCEAARVCGKGQRFDRLSFDFQ